MAVWEEIVELRYFNRLIKVRQRKIDVIKGGDYNG